MFEKVQLWSGRMKLRAGQILKNILKYYKFEKF